MEIRGFQFVALGSVAQRSAAHVHHTWSASQMLEVLVLSLDGPYVFCAIAPAAPHCSSVVASQTILKTETITSLQTYWLHAVVAFP
jgi:hypothetical protein